MINLHRRLIFKTLPNPAKHRLLFCVYFEMFTLCFIPYCFYWFKVVDGVINLDLLPDQVYTFTTLTTGHKGSFPDAPPPPKDFPLPYNDDFESKCKCQRIKTFLVTCRLNVDVVIHHT